MTRFALSCCLAAVLSQSLSAQGVGTTRDILVLNVANVADAPLPGSTGSLELVEKAGRRMLRASGASSFRVSLPEVLPENFTLEFDLVPKECCSAEDLAFAGTLTRDDTFARVSWGRENQVVNGGGTYFTATASHTLSATLSGQLTHVVATFEGGLLKVYTNGERLYTVTERRFPRGSVLRVFLGGDDEDKGAVYLARLRVAAGIATPTVNAVMATSTGTGMLSSPGTVSSSQALTAGATMVTGLTVTLDAQGKAILKWVAVPDATAYAAMRWNVNDLACCKNLSPSMSTTQWDDGSLADGTYGYRVYATTTAATVVGETRVTVKGGTLTEAIASAGSGSIASPAPSPPAPLPPPPPPIVNRDEGVVGRNSGTTVMSNAPAATIAPITGTPGMAMVRWNPPAGAVNYVVMRREASNPAGQRTPSPITQSYYNDPISNPAATYSYQVIAYQSNGSYGASAWVTYTPPALLNPSGFAARQIGPGEVMLSWQKVEGASGYRVDGSNLPSAGVTGADPFLDVPGLGEGAASSWKVAAVYGDNLFDLTTRPSASITLPTTPWRSVPWLTMRNGAGNEGDQLTYYNAMLDQRNFYPNSTCTQQLVWKCMAAEWWIVRFPVNGAFLQRWGYDVRTGGATVFETVFADPRDMGAGRRVMCAQYKPETAPGIPGLTYKTLCWASTHGPVPGTAGWGDAKVSLDAALGGNPNRGWTFLEQSDKGPLFAAFEGLEGSPFTQGYSADQLGPPKPSSVFDPEGPKLIPNACLACHGGRLNTTTHKVEESSFVPLDPSVLVFPTTPGKTRKDQEESIRQINLVVLNANPSPAVAAYIRGLYRGTPEAAGTTADDNYIPRGWSNAPDLYRKIVKPYCQGCHLQQQPRIDFASYENFLTLKASIVTAVCTTRTMPHAEAPFKALWRDGNGESLPDYLMTALGMPKCAP